MVAILQEYEDLPEAYPPQPENLLTDESELDAGFIWQRIESWVTTRWSARQVTWVVEGPGEWTPRLSPATVTQAEIWMTGNGWQTVALEPAPTGYALPSFGPYRIIAMVGDGSVPAAVNEAYRRLAEYLAGADRWSGVTSDVQEVGEIKINTERSHTWLSRAMSYSGAADLLRPYRRL